jgi:hypothetical protein
VSLHADEPRRNRRLAPGALRSRVVWQNGELGIYCPNALEEADVWERAQVEAALRDLG